MIDLSAVDEHSRAGVWADAAPALFPGVSIHDMPATMPVGQIRTMPMGGAGSLWSVLSGPLQLNYAPAGDVEDSRSHISLMMQVEGAMTVHQSHRACHLTSGDLCLVDERYPFCLKGQGCNEIVFLRMPRHAVLGRHPYLEHHTAGLLSRDDPGSILLQGTFLQAIHAAPTLRTPQRGAVLSAIVHLLGAAALPGSSGAEGVNWRVRSALAYIEMNLGDAELTAERIAETQGISRRRLDQLLCSALGVSVTSRLWDRRLEQAAADLIDPRHGTRSVSQIATGVGFAEAAHFSRAFKARFGQTPRDWRRHGQRDS